MIIEIGKVVTSVSSKSDFLNRLLGQIGKAKLILIGDASHGTEEFYQTRIEITKHLIMKKTYRVNRYVNGDPKDQNALKALGDFERFPTWMWANRQFSDFIEWLKEYNKTIPPSANEKVCIYGMDLYSLYKSIDAVLGYLKKVNEKDFLMAKDAYSGFIQYHGNTEEYGYMAAFGGIKSHEAEVRQVLIQMYANSQSYLKATGYLNGDELFAGLRNADVVKHAEMYYRAMYSYDEDTWNIRDIFFSDAIEAMLEHFSSFRHLENPGCCVWAHNSHCGNAAFTGASRRGQTNIGEILKKKFPDECFAIGTCTYYGSVTAANEWDDPAQFMKVRRGLRDSFENLFHEVAKTRDEKNFLFIPNDVPEFSQLKLLERYIGVIYRPQTEKASHYSVSCMGKEFDAICFFDFSNALEPIVLGSIWKRQSEKFGIPMELAIDIYPESPEIRNIASGKAIDIAMQLHKLGQVYMQNDYAEIALEKFTKGLKYSEHPEVPKSLKVELLLHSASCHLKIKAWTKAIRNCDEILKFDDKNTLAIQLKTQALAEITLGSK